MEVVTPDKITNNINLNLQTMPITIKKKDEPLRKPGSYIFLHVVENKKGIQKIELDLLDNIEDAIFLAEKEKGSAIYAKRADNNEMELIFAND